MFIIVSFPPKKCDLFVNTSKTSSQHNGAEIKKIKPSNESNDLQVTDLIKFKKQKLKFEPFLELDSTKISTTIDEIGLNEIVPIERIVFNLKEEKVKFKEGK